MQLPVRTHILFILVKQVDVGAPLLLPVELFLLDVGPLLRLLRADKRRAGLVLDLGTPKLGLHLLKRILHLGIHSALENIGRLDNIHHLASRLEVEVILAQRRRDAELTCRMNALRLHKLGHRAVVRPDFEERKDLVCHELVFALGIGIHHPRLDTAVVFREGGRGCQESGLHVVEEPFSVHTRDADEHNLVCALELLATCLGPTRVHVDTPLNRLGGERNTFVPCLLAHLTSGARGKSCFTINAPFTSPRCRYN